MYTNIHTNEGVTAIKNWLTHYAHELPADFPSELFVEVLDIVMSNNVFQFDDTYWLQLIGTAMGTSTACDYANVFAGYGERHILLPRYQQELQVLQYAGRLIDDFIGVWVPTTTAGDVDAEWEAFKADLNGLSMLDWDVSKLVKSVDFLDLTITINDNGHVEFKTYQKELNLYLYIPPSSAHPPGCFQGLIIGNLQTYWQ